MNRRGHLQPVAPGRDHDGEAPLGVGLGDRHAVDVHDRGGQPAVAAAREHRPLHRRQRTRRWEGHHARPRVRRRCCHHRRAAAIRRAPRRPVRRPARPRRHGRRARQRPARRRPVQRRTAGPARARRARRRRAPRCDAARSRNRRQPEPVARRCAAAADGVRDVAARFIDIAGRRQLGDRARPAPDARPSRCRGSPPRRCRPASSSDR